MINLDQILKEAIRYTFSNGEKTNAKNIKIFK